MAAWEMLINCDICRNTLIIRRVGPDTGGRWWWVFRNKVSFSTAFIKWIFILNRLLMVLASVYICIYKALEDSLKNGKWLPKVGLNGIKKVTKLGS